MAYNRRAADGRQCAEWYVHGADGDGVRGDGADSEPHVPSARVGSVSAEIGGGENRRAFGKSKNLNHACAVESGEDTRSANGENALTADGKGVRLNHKAALSDGERYLFLYLDTGSGHVTPARIIKAELEKSGATVTLANGFAKHQFLLHAAFESSYHAMATALPASYSLIYELTQIPFVLAACKFACTVFTQFYIARLIKKHRITKVVCFHFAVGPAAYRAIKRVNPKIPYIVDITDPFTAHTAWYLVKNARFIAHSETLKNTMVNVHGIKARNVAVLPFVFDECFNGSATSTEVNVIKIRHGVNPKSKVVLVAGGGEGLPRMVHIVRSFISSLESENTTEPITVVAVCGKNSESRMVLENLAILHPLVCLKVLGFVTNMDELIKISDCVVTKAGASMMMQVLACKKPLIVSAYIHGQEKGNVEFVLKNRVGWFIRSPKAIVEKAIRVCTDTAYAQKVTARLESHPIESGGAKVARFISEVT